MSDLHTGLLVANSWLYLIYLLLLISLNSITEASRKLYFSFEEIFKRNCGSSRTGVFSLSTIGQYLLLGDVQKIHENADPDE